MRKIFIIVLLCCGPHFLFSVIAQNVFTGTVRDSQDNSPIPNVPIKVNGDSQLYTTDLEGKFRIEVREDSCSIEFVSVMYEPVKRNLIFTKKKKEIKSDIILQSTSFVLNEASVITGKYEKEPAKSSSSLVIITPKDNQNRNMVSMDNLINTVSGIVVVDNEPQIRGGSGYSSGMGSRVMIMMDDMPLLRPDAGRPMWNFIPMESVEQVDVMKGASSVLFGSSALTGAINVLTAYPRQKPKTMVTLYAGMYDDPICDWKTSWIHNNPLRMGLSFLHSRIIKNNFDLVLGGEIFDDQSYIGPDERVCDTRNMNGETAGKYEKRYRFNFSTRYRSKKIKTLSVSLSGNFMYSDNTQSYIWFDSDTNMYRTYSGSLSHYKDFTFYIDPVVKYVDKSGGSHCFRNRYLNVNSNELTGKQSSKATMYFDEYQYTKFFKKSSLKFTAGIANILTTSFGPVFSGVSPDVYIEEDNYEYQESMVYAENFALYAQLEKKFLKRKNLSLVFGERWDCYKLWGESVETEFTQNNIHRVGVNYQLRSQTSFKASFGQGYRFPTIGEKFISLTIGDYGFYPNKELLPETSMNFEVGVIQPVRLFDFVGVIDVSYFHQNFKNFIEFCLGPWGNSGPFHKRLGYKFINIGPARVNGVDFSLIGKGEISNNVSYILNVSYTYSNPVTQDREFVYYSYGVKDYNFENSCYDTSRNVLKYRIEHMCKLDLEFLFAKKLSFGVTMNYYSAMKNVDKFLFEYDASNPTLPELRRKILRSYGDLPFDGFYNYYLKSKKGALVFDARISYQFDKVSLSFIAKNVFNKEYALRPLYMESTRTFTLQFVYKMN